ncbi:hypothetical protein [Oscillatoria acuminata]|nr:hypothetical protein [Oscillatoria acuminata]
MGSPKSPVVQAKFGMLQGPKLDPREVLGSRLAVARKATASEKQES